MSLVVRKPAVYIYENKDEDQLRGDREADQRLCFRYTDRTIHLLPKSEISSLLPSSVAVQPGLCRTSSETPKTGFLTSRLKKLKLRLQQRPSYIAWLKTSACKGTSCNYSMSTCCTLHVRNNFPHEVANVDLLNRTSKSPVGLALALNMSAQGMI